MISKPIPYGKQYIDQNDIDAVVEALKGDFLTQGPYIPAFEKAFAEYNGAKYAVAVSNGTAALHLCALALGVNENTRVITTPITFVASANCVKYCGGEIDFCDIDPNTITIDLNKLRVMLESKPKGYYTGVIPVDFGGYPVDLKAIREIADEFGLWIIEDACHAPGGYRLYNGVKENTGQGNYADLAIFSFHPVKHIATAEGGMITTNSEDLYNKLLRVRTHGITKDTAQMSKVDGGWYYEMKELGYNYRLTDIQAALGISQLKRAEAGLEKRHIIAKRYELELAGLPLTLPNIFVEGIHHALHLYLIQTENRKEFYDFLKSNNIFTQVHYVPVHTMPYYAQFGWKYGDFPISENYYEHCLSLPMYPTLTGDEQSYVIETIKTFYNHK
ncbi:MAG: UDP-4-amino-4,6-dideoxy-N-acetyl-beta-L-altrosamine transaminase [Bacteroidota bacterium]|nr:UDP-4-amino-4,6-dideoxy-N-acetyl-beta-L-altrosamine transaminase [Bacteroidota bacterium]